jgi:hypothetical protein
MEVKKKVQVGDWLFSTSELVGINSDFRKKYIISEILQFSERNI